jgi:hypothetical protein
MSNDTHHNSGSLESKFGKLKSVAKAILGSDSLLIFRSFQARLGMNESDHGGSSGLQQASRYVPPHMRTRSDNPRPNGRGSGSSNWAASSDRPQRTDR